MDSSIDVAAQCAHYGAPDFENAVLIELNRLEFRVFRTQFDFPASAVKPLDRVFTIDNRNHPKTPTSGTFFQTGVDVAGLGGDVHYARLSAEGRAYYPVAEKVTLVGRGGGGNWSGHCSMEGSVRVSLSMRST